MDERRSLDQSALFHAICTDISKSGMEWAGKVRSKDEWKILLISAHAVATGRPGEVIQGLEGELVAIRESTARMSRERASSLIEYSIAFAAENEIPLNDPKILAYQSYKEMA